MAKHIRVRNKIKEFLGDGPKNTNQIYEFIKTTYHYEFTRAQLTSILSKAREIVNVGDDKVAVWSLYGDTGEGWLSPRGDVEKYLGRSLGEFIRTNPIRPKSVKKLINFDLKIKKEHSLNAFDYIAVAYYQGFVSLQGIADSIGVGPLFVSKMFKQLKFPIYSFWFARDERISKSKSSILDIIDSEGLPVRDLNIILSEEEVDFYFGLFNLNKLKPFFIKKTYQKFLDFENNLLFELGVPLVEYLFYSHHLGNKSQVNLAEEIGVSTRIINRFFEHLFLPYVTSKEYRFRLLDTKVQQLLNENIDIDTDVTDEVLDFCVGYYSLDDLVGIMKKNNLDKLREFEEFTLENYCLDAISYIFLKHHLEPTGIISIYKDEVGINLRKVFDRLRLPRMSQPEIATKKAIVKKEIDPYETITPKFAKLQEIGIGTDTRLYGDKLQAILGVYTIDDIQNLFGLNLINRLRKFEETLDEPLIDYWIKEHHTKLIGFDDLSYGVLNEITLKKIFDELGIPRLNYQKRLSSKGLKPLSIDKIDVSLPKPYWYMDYMKTTGYVANDAREVLNDEEFDRLVALEYVVSYKSGLSAIDYLFNYAQHLNWDLGKLGQESHIKEKIIRKVFEGLGKNDPDMEFVVTNY